jgi:hypothetical protein
MKAAKTYIWIIIFLEDINKKKIDVWIARNMFVLESSFFSRFLENSFGRDCKKFGYNI